VAEAEEDLATAYEPPSDSLASAATDLSPRSDAIETAAEDLSGEGDKEKTIKKIQQQTSSLISLIRSYQAGDIGGNRDFKARENMASVIINAADELLGYQGIPTGTRNVATDIPGESLGFFDDGGMELIGQQAEGGGQRLIAHYRRVEGKSVDRMELSVSKGKEFVPVIIRPITEPQPDTAPEGEKSPQGESKLPPEAEAAARAIFQMVPKRLNPFNPESARKVQESGILQKFRDITENLSFPPDLAYHNYQLDGSDVVSITHPFEPDYSIRLSRGNQVFMYCHLGHGKDGDGVYLIDSRTLTGVRVLDGNNQIVSVTEDKSNPAQTQTSTPEPVALHFDVTPPVSSDQLPATNAVTEPIMPSVTSQPDSNLSDEQPHPAITPSPDATVSPRGGADEIGADGQSELGIPKTWTRERPSSDPRDRE